MMFKSEAQLKKYILTKCKTALIQTEQKVYMILEEHVRRFYGEYSPTMYKRTLQFYKGLVASEVVSTGNGYKAEVYFDMSRMNHPRDDWSEEEIFENVMTGTFPHGGWQPAGGTGIWTTAEPVIKAEAIQDLKRALIANGIPIR